MGRLIGQWHSLRKDSSFLSKCVNHILNKKLATKLWTDNVLFYGQRPLEVMPYLYKITGAVLATLEDKPYANMTILGKVQSYMAVGNSIIGAINGSCSNFIINNEIGFVRASGDSESLATKIKNLGLANYNRLAHILKIFIATNILKAYL